MTQLIQLNDNQQQPSQERSGNMALSQNSESASGEKTKHLSFLLGTEIFGIAILPIKEIIEFSSIAAVPMAASHIRGVINLRGNVVPVIDLACRLGLPSSKISKRTCIVIVETESDGEKMIIGIIVDSVNEVLDIPADQLEQAPAFGANISSNFITGMGRVNQRFIVMLDLDRVLDVEELSELAQ